LAGNDSMMRRYCRWRFLFLKKNQANEGPSLGCLASRGGPAIGCAQHVLM